MIENRRQAVGIAALTILAVVGIVLLAMHFRSAPQMGADAEVFKTVDALFTALTSRNRSRLEDCERRLHQYRESGQLPEKAAAFLDDIVADAKSGKWEPAAHTLYDFMMQQRR